MLTQRNKICFLLPDLSRGGAQRIMSFLAQNLDKDVFDCTLVVVNPKSETDFKLENVKIKYLNKSRLLHATLPLFKFLKKEKFNIVIGSIGHINLILSFYSLFFKKTKFIGREASLDTIIQKYNKTNRRFLFGNFTNDYRNRLDAIICQSEDMALDSVKAYNLDKHKVFTVNNPLTIEVPNDLKNKSSNSPKKLITVGRLSEEKGHKRILNVLSQLNFNWHYSIVGSGIEKDNIEKQIKSLNLIDKVSLIPHVNNVTEILPDFDLFLQGSFVEGFPNATMESCGVGTPVVAFKAPGGTREIIQHNVNGYLANDENDFLKFIKIALTEKDWDRKTVSNSITNKFNSKLILSQYETIFLSLIKN